jgi:hypothetical protein
MRLVAIPALPKNPFLGEDGLSDPQAEPGDGKIMELG